MIFDILDENGNVINRIVSSQEFVEQQYPNRWVLVEEQNEQKDTWKITKLAFKNRFPREKWIAAKLASSTDVQMEDFFETFNLSTYVDLKRPDTIQSVMFLTQETVPESYRLTEQECNTVLNTPAQPEEIPLFV